MPRRRLSLRHALRFRLFLQQNGCFDTIAQLQLLQNVRYVMFDGFLFQVELAGDLQCAGQPPGRVWGSVWGSPSG